MKARAHVRNVGLAVGTLLASSATLACCVLPAVLVSLGAGATLVSLLNAAPQLVWLSEHKVPVFSIAAVLLFASGLLIWRARSLPCPADPRAARTCQRLRRTSGAIYGVALCAYAAGVTFAFIIPASL